MKVLIVYDSNFGNTQKIAKEIEKELTPFAKAVSLKHVKTEDIGITDVLIVGSPITTSGPTQNMLWFIYRLNSYGKKGIKAVAFDTRVKSWLSENAAKVMSKALKDRGFRIIEKPEGFYVTGKEGPLKEGELGRARSWAKHVLARAEEI